ncbi:hypothetical protein CK203_008866 [Vitis vinifera]|uniref:Protein kinesin light chain-related 1 n=1 Tax=Vitis vinifera TaxID=29760 RepID=A0A438KDC4_VITVI|nr:hypothetical protein CK203_008866 [Vitis vinifera]
MRRASSKLVSHLSYYRNLTPLLSRNYIPELSPSISANDHVSSLSSSSSNHIRPCKKASGLLLSKAKSDPFQTNSSRNLNTQSETPPQISSRQRKIKERSQLEETFESATSTESMLKAFQEMESSFDEKELGLASLKLGLKMDQEEEEGSCSVDDIRPVLHAVQLELANVKTAVGRREEALVNLTKCLEIKEMTLEKDSKELGAAYRDLAEAHTAATSWVVYTGLEEHQKALEQNELSQKVLKNWGLSSELLRAEIDAANMQIALGKYDEAINTLKGVVQRTDKESENRALVFISMAKALCNQEKFADSKRCLEIACGVLDKREMVSPVEVAEAYMEISMQYETMNEFETAISLLKRTLAMLEKLPQEQHSEGSVSARIGWLLLLTAYLELDRPQSAAQMFAVAKDIMDVSLGPHHADSIEACQNLSKAYGAMEVDSYPKATSREYNSPWK